MRLGPLRRRLAGPLPPPGASKGLYLLFAFCGLLGSVPKPRYGDIGRDVSMEMGNANEEFLLFWVSSTWFLSS